MVYKTPMCRIFFAVLAAILVAAGIIYLVIDAHKTNEAFRDLEKSSARADRVIESLKKAERK